MLLAASLALWLIAAPGAAAQSAGWQPGPGAIADAAHTGFIDAPAAGDVVSSSGSFFVRGWFVDTAAQGWAGADDVEVWLGPMNAGGQLLATAMFGQPRPDVGAALGNPFWSASGFFAKVTGASVPGGPQTLFVYAHTPANGWWFRTVEVNGGANTTTGTTPSGAAIAAGGPPQLKVVQPTEGQNIPTGSPFTITGVVNHPSTTTIEVWVNGDRSSETGSELGTTTPQADGSWSFVFKPKQFPNGHNNLFVYATDSATTLQTEALVGFNVVSH
jgi:hypothetical protein